MHDGRLELNSSPLGIILNLLSTISFYESVDELCDKSHIKDKDEEGNLFFLSLTLPSLLSLGLVKGNFLSFSLSCIVYLTSFLKTFIGFLCWLIISAYYMISSFMIFFASLITNHKRSNICIIPICMHLSDFSLKTRGHCSTWQNINNLFSFGNELDIDYFQKIIFIFSFKIFPLISTISTLKRVRFNAIPITKLYY